MLKNQTNIAAKSRGKKFFNLKIEFNPSSVRVFH